MRSLRRAWIATLALALIAPASASAVAIRVFDAGTGAEPRGITVGPDGNLWLAKMGAPVTPGGSIRGPGYVVRMSLSGGVLNAWAMGADTEPFGITSGPDGRVWVTLRRAKPDPAPETIARGEVVRINPSTLAVERYPAATKENNPKNENSRPRSIVTGPDGNLWYTVSNRNLITTMSPTSPPGKILSQYTVPKTGAEFPFPLGLTNGPDGALWFTEPGPKGELPDNIGRITTSGAITEFPVRRGSSPADITTGVDGRLWYATEDGDTIGRINTSGGFEEFNTSVGAGVRNIARGPDDNMWFTESTLDRLGRITLTGSVTEFPLPAGADPQELVLGPDGNLWIALKGTNQVARVVREAPVATTGAATERSRSSATLRGTVDPRAEATSFRFEYGRTTSYGRSTAAQSAGGGTGGVAVAAAIRGLSPRKRYHYRIVATNAVGTTVGGDRSFRTPRHRRLRDTVKWSFLYDGAQTRVTKLVATAIPAGVRARLVCKGPGCPSKKRITGKRGAKRVSFTKRFTRPLRPGAVIEVRLSGRRVIGVATRFTVRFDQIPKRRVLCIKPGRNKPSRTC